MCRVSGALALLPRSFTQISLCPLTSPGGVLVFPCCPSLPFQEASLYLSSPHLTTPDDLVQLKDSVAFAQSDLIPLLEDMDREVAMTAFNRTRQLLPVSRLYAMNI